MTKKKLKKLITQATNELTPNKVAFEFVDKDVLKIYVVSDYFNAIGMSKRFTIMSTILEKYAPEIAKKYTLIYETLTSKEVDEMDASKKDSPKVLFCDVKDIWKGLWL